VAELNSEAARAKQEMAALQVSYRDAETKYNEL